MQEVFAFYFIFHAEIFEQKIFFFSSDRIEGQWRKFPPQNFERRQYVNWCLYTTWLCEMHIYCYQFSNQQITHIFYVWVVTDNSIKIPTCLETTVYLKALLMVIRNQVVSHRLPSILREEIWTFICLYHYIFLIFFNSPPRDLIIQ